MCNELPDRRRLRLPWHCVGSVSGKYRRQPASGNARWPRFPPEAAEQVIALLQTVPDIHSASRETQSACNCSTSSPIAKRTLPPRSMSSPTISTSRHHRCDLPDRQAGPAARGARQCGLHSKADKNTGAFPIEVTAAKMIIAAAAAENVKQGKFRRFQHNKVFIKRDASGNAQKVIFGSMNFSVRGILRAGQQRRIRRNSHSRAHWPSLQSLFQAEKKRYYSAVVARRSA